MTTTMSKRTFKEQDEADEKLLNRMLVGGFILFGLAVLAPIALVVTIIIVLLALVF